MGTAWSIFVLSATCVGSLLTQAAYAQASCDDIKRMTGLAAQSFVPIRKEELADGLYEPTMKLANASECQIEEGFSVIYRCIWQYSSASDLRAAHDRQASIVKSCISSWTAYPRVLDRVDPDAHLKGYGTDWVRLNQSPVLGASIWALEQATPRGSSFELQLWAIKEG